MKLKSVLMFALIIIFGLFITYEVRVPGKYEDLQNKDRSLILVDDGTFLIFSGFTGDYSVQGNKIIFNDSSFGKAKGMIEGGKITFPVEDSNEIAKNVAGVWIKQNIFRRIQEGIKSLFA